MKISVVNQVLFLKPLVWSPLVEQIESTICCYLKENFLVEISKFLYLLVYLFVAWDEIFRKCEKLWFFIGS